VAHHTSDPPGGSGLRDYFRTLARYHVWATRKLAGHIDALSEADYRRDVGLFFRSVHGTCNHLLVAEHRLWYARFAEGRSESADLAEEIEPDRDRLRERLVDAAERWPVLIDHLAESRFGSSLDYTTTRGIAQSLPFAPTLGHVFNHATHHRGQTTAAITAMGYPCPEIDMVWMLQEESRAGR